MSPSEAAATATMPNSDYTFALEALDRPVIAADEAAALVERHWGLQVQSVKELGSYEDRNFLVTGKGIRLIKIIFKAVLSLALIVAAAHNSAGYRLCRATARICF
jgi:hypothetical protein